MNDNKFNELKRIVQEEEERIKKIEKLKMEIECLNSRYKLHKSDGFTRNLRTVIKQAWYEVSCDGHGPGSDGKLELYLDEKESEILNEAFEMLAKNKQLELEKELKELEEYED